MGERGNEIGEGREGEEEREGRREEKMGMEARQRNHYEFRDLSENRSTCSIVFVLLSAVVTCTVYQFCHM